MKTYNEYLEEQKKDNKEKKDKYIELGIGDRDRERKEEKKTEHIELGIGDRER